MTQPCLAPSFAGKGEESVLASKSAAMSASRHQTPGWPVWPLLRGAAESADGKCWKITLRCRRLPLRGGAVNGAEQRAPRKPVQG